MEILDISTLEKYDSQKMYKIYDKWPKIAKESFEFEHKIVNFQNIDHIVFAGMGGSGTLGDIFSSILSKTNIHVSIVKGYLLPKTVDENTLVIVTADHETGGLTLSGGSVQRGISKGTFSTKGHSATMVPVFSYGPRAELFKGIYENTAIFDKMLESVSK